MRETDYHMCQCLQTGEMAFHFSSYAKYGVEGKLRFLRPWIKAYVKKAQDKKHIKHIHRLFLKIKTDVELLDFWEHSYQSYKEMITLVLDSKLKTDLARLQDFEKETKALGINCYTANELDTTKSELSIAFLAQDKDALTDGNIDNETPLPVYINSGFKNEKAQLVISNLQNYGFSINDIDETDKSMTLYLSSAFLCPFNRKLTGP